MAIISKKQWRIEPETHLSHIGYLIHYTTNVYILIQQKSYISVKKALGLFLKKIFKCRIFMKIDYTYLSKDIFIYL